MFGLKNVLSLAVVLPFARLAVGQAAEWGQCGGIGWTGATTCGEYLRHVFCYSHWIPDLTQRRSKVSGTVCTKLNDYYSQCLPGSATTPPPTTTVPATTPPPGTTTSTGSAPPGLSSIPASTLHQITGFGTNPNNVGVYVYKPARVAANPPLIVASHCTSRDVI